MTPLLFYDIKISFLHAVLNASTRRSLEQPPPEIKMDPLESVAGEHQDAVVVYITPYMVVYTTHYKLHSLYGNGTTLQSTLLIRRISLSSGLASTPLTTQFCQAARQMLSVPSPQLCVPLASGGDPTYAFNVKLAGEEVHGTSKLSEYRIIDFEFTSLCLLF